MLRAQLLRTSVIIAAMAALSAVCSVARAEEPRSFILPENDGYGVGECLAQGPKSSCGRVVADAWCESKGYAKAKTFGRGDMGDVTGSVRPGATPVADAPAPTMVIITCDG
ncbi:hypothetical protein [Terrarubrum flagellatum]|uniref:hypothetical protein n=1 Tax=Terrirubrum flagellatum TaxID=2895980 RepID=UPI003144FDAA